MYTLFASGFTLIPGAGRMFNLAPDELVVPAGHITCWLEPWFDRPFTRPAGALPVGSGARLVLCERRRG